MIGGMPTVRGRAMSWRRWATAGLVAAGLTPPAVAQPLAPTGGPPSVQGMAPDRPPAVLGAPVAVRGEPVRPTADPIPDTADDLPPAPAAFRDTPPPHRRERAVGLRPPTAAGSPVSAAAVEARPPVGPTADPVNDLLDRRAGGRDGDRLPTDRSRKLGEKLEGWFGRAGEWFKGDHAFDGFASPVTNPFLFEDPRSVTEIRPLYLYQRIPGQQPDAGGGNAQFFGLQGRLAVTERLSLVLHKLGGVRLDPNNQTPYRTETGFAELWLGPKFTFIRNPEAGRLLAGGLQFQIPIGSAGVMQDTGSLSLVPYASFGQSFFRESRVGTVNTLATGGYALSTNSARSDYLFLSGHVDVDVLNWHHVYPLAELNYVLVTTNGTARPVGSEGRDLFNLGGQASGNGLLTGAIGARFKISERAQFGGAYEFPLAGPRDLFDYRFTLDFIWRF